MELKTFFAQDEKGTAIPGAAVHVYVSGTTKLAGGLQNRYGHTLSNPFYAESNGQIQFVAPNGMYDLHVSCDECAYSIPVKFLDIEDTGTLGVMAEGTNDHRSLAAWTRAIRKRIIYAESVAELQSFDVDRLTEGQPIHLLGFHAGSRRGGQMFRWSATRKKADHNGWSVISSTVPFSWHDGGTGFLSGAGETHPQGQGCFERELPEGLISLYMAGAKCNGKHDDWPAYDAIAKTRLPIYIPSTESGCRLTKGIISNSQRSVTIHGDPGSYSKVFMDCVAGQGNPFVSDGIPDRYGDWEDAITCGVHRTKPDIAYLDIDCQRTCRHGVLQDSVAGWGGCHHLSVRNTLRDGIALRVAGWGYIENFNNHDIVLSNIGRHFISLLAEKTLDEAPAYINEGEFCRIEGRGCAQVVPGRAIDARLINVAAVHGDKMSRVTFSHINMDGQGVHAVESQLAGGRAAKEVGCGLLPTPILLVSEDTHGNPRPGIFESFTFVLGGMENLGQGANPGGYLIELGNELTRVSTISVPSGTPYFAWSNGGFGPNLTAQQAGILIDGASNGSVYLPSTGNLSSGLSIGASAKAHDAGFADYINTATYHNSSYRAAHGEGWIIFDIPLKASGDTKSIANGAFDGGLLEILIHHPTFTSDIRTHQIGRYYVSISNDKGTYKASALLVENVSGFVSHGFDPDGDVTFSVTNEGEGLHTLIVKIALGKDFGRSGASKTLYISANRMGSANSNSHVTKLRI